MVGAAVVGAAVVAAGREVGGLTVDSVGASVVLGEAPSTVVEVELVDCDRAVVVVR